MPRTAERPIYGFATHPATPKIPTQIALRPIRLQFMSSFAFARELFVFVEPVAAVTAAVLEVLVRVAVTGGTGISASFLPINGCVLVYSPLVEWTFSSNT